MMINNKIFKLSIEKDGPKFGPDFDSSLLKTKENLFSKFWGKGVNGRLNTIVSRKLMEIADNIIDSLNLDVDPKDIIITGSIASYNWHELSDIDLHILYDFEEINQDFELVKKMFDQTRINWNKTHNIKIAGKEVELYFQHAYEPHQSNGVWSLDLEKWIVMPVKLNPELDLRTIETKAESLAQCIEHLYDLFKEEKYKEAYKFSIKLKKKIARMRKSGLSRDGIFSLENLAFKMLRNAGYLEKLSSLKIQAYDKTMSVDL